MCAQEKSCGGFTVDTDYNVNHCNLVMGRSLGREDFIDEEMGGDGDGRYHLEGFKKGRGRG